jgi:hypothetical protein
MEQHAHHDEKKEEPPFTPVPLSKEETQFWIDLSKKPRVSLASLNDKLEDGVGKFRVLVTVSLLNASFERCHSNRISCF